ncbi:MAG TPA: hypothetical protein VM098_06385, partial [Phycisphaerae bacterium]|nr:hypothetical protein [Phycisphaerae bacterium]
GYNVRMFEKERPKTPQQGRPRTGVTRLLLHEQEADDYLALGIRGQVGNTVHWGLAHQPIRRGGCLNDPALVQFALQEMTIAAQHIRRFPSINGASSGDELALTWTPNKAGNFDTVGNCRLCRAAFEAEAGHPAPAREEAGNDEALWARWMRWRSDTWTDFMTAVGHELKAVAPEKLWLADVYASTAFGDGVYPTQATAGDGLFTHHYSVWDAAGQGVVPMACELQRAGCNWEMPFWPMVSGWLLQELEPQLHRHMINLAVSRKIDGIGTWGPLGGEPGEAVIKEAMGRLTRYGDFFRSLKRRRGDVAVLYSVTEMAHLLGGTFEDSYARNENRLAHVLPFAEAFLTSYRAHCNTSVILEEEILAGDLKYYKVLLVPAAPHLPKGVAAAIERFVEAGGTAFVEKSSPLAIKGTQRLGIDFSTLAEARKKTAEAYAAEKQRNDGKTDEQSVYEVWKLESDVVQEAGIDRQSKILDPLLAKIITKFADTPRPRVMLSEQDFGDARYVFAVNSEMALPDAPISKMTSNGRLFATQHIVPVETTLSFQKDAGRYAAYDLYEGKAVDLSKPLPLALELGGMKVLCLLPRKIDGLRVTAPPAGKAGTSVEVAIAVLGGGAPINAAIPLEITIADPDGASQTVCRAAAPGTYTHKLDLPLNVKAGEWRVTARELLSGKQAACSIAVEAGDPMQMARLLPELQVFDETSIKGFFEKKRPVWVVSGQAAAGPVTKLAQDLAAALKEAGILAEYRAAEAIRQDHKNLPAYLDAWV